MNKMVSRMVTGVAVAAVMGAAAYALNNSKNRRMRQFRRSARRTVHAVEGIMHGVNTVLR